MTQHKSKSKHLLTLLHTCHVTCYIMTLCVLGIGIGIWYPLVHQPSSNNFNSKKRVYVQRTCEVKIVYK